MSVEIAQGYLPGAVGRITGLHAGYYAAHRGFGPMFECRVASELAAFVQRYDHARDGIWLLLADGCIEGSIVIDGIDAHGAGAHLRWYIVSDALRETGMGKRLIQAAMEFCRQKQYRKVYLDTVAGLDAARHLYDQCGFRVVSEQRGSQWGAEALEQRLECHL